MWTSPRVSLKPLTSDREAVYTERLSTHVEEKGAFHCIVDCVDDFDAWQSCTKTLVSSFILALARLLTADTTVQDKSGIYTSVGYDFTNGIPTVIRRVLNYQFLPAWLGGVPRRFTRPGLFNSRDIMDTLSSLVEQGEYDMCASFSKVC